MALRFLPGLPPRFVLAVAVACAMHAVSLLVLVPFQASVAGHPWISVTPGMAVRMVAPSATPPFTGAAVEASQLPAEVALVSKPLARADSEPVRTSVSTGMPASRALQRPRPALPVDASPSIDATAIAIAIATAPPARTVSASAAKSTPLPVLPGLPPAPSYLSSGQLDPGPHPLTDIEPVYPLRAGQQQGTVVLRMLINEQGIVDNVAVVRATPAGVFDESALEAFGSARFSPGRVLGVPVKSQITIEVEFTPINRGATVSGRSY